MPEQSNDYRVVVFGAAGVGKSSLVLRFVKGKKSKWDEVERVGRQEETRKSDFPRGPLVRLFNILKDRERLT